ncbi:MAG: hydroxymethylbilane synthase [Deltaproteobacteria bacterium]|nr:hydroxymethylbilane synthase [Deltaproteobacteria bacterium]
MKKSIRIGTRGSVLALIQAEGVKAQLETRHPRLYFELTVIKTTGDKILDVPLAAVGGKGLFVKEIEEALLDGRIDLAVHSMKDVPTVFPAELTMGAITRREDPRDVLISRKQARLDALPREARIGTSSLRRQSQLLNLRPDFTIVPLRGNLDTRIKKLETEQLDGIIVAAAGVIRMGWQEKIAEHVPPARILPAIGQGALGIQIRRDDSELGEIISFLHNSETAVTVGAERMFLTRLEGGCQVPIAAFGVIEKGMLSLEGLIGSLDGTALIRDAVRGMPEEGEKLGIALAEKLLSSGGAEILGEVYGRKL